LDGYQSNKLNKYIMTDEGLEGDKTDCGCKANDDLCKCVDGKKVFIKIPRQD